MSKGRIITIAVLLAFVLIIVLPPIAYRYVYPNASDDTAMHLEVFDRITEGKTTEFSYYGQAIVGYPLVKISQGTGVSIDYLFLWFNFLVLVGVGFSLYFILSRLVNREAGLMAIPLAVFCSQGILILFYSGTIFSLINTCIILPFAMYFIVKSIIERKRWQIVGAVGTTSLFTIFHPTGLLMPAIQTIQHRVSNMSPDIIAADLGITFPTPAVFIFKCVTLAPLIFILAAIVLMVNKKIKVNRNAKLLLILVGTYTAILAITAALGLSPDPGRQAIDISTMLAIIAACLMGIVIANYRRKALTGIVVIGLVCCSIVPIACWLGISGTNTALKTADLEAIAYINSLGNSSYNCSTQVAPWIYSRYLEKEYVKGAANFTIYRSKPMTARTDPRDYYYGYYHENGEISKLEDYTGLKLLRKFDDGEVKVYVFAGS